MTGSDATGRRIVLKAGVLFGLAALSGCSTSGLWSGAGGTGSDMTAAALGHVNALRTARGLPPLSRDPAAAAAAIEQAGRMARAGKMQHDIGLGPSFYARMKGQDVTLPAAENIAAGQADADAAYLAWLRSPKHLENMLGSTYRGLGVAVAHDPASQNRPYWAMVLSS